MSSIPSCVDFRAGWVANHAALLDQLSAEIGWEQHEITLFGRTVPTPRLTAWIGDVAYGYSGVVNQPRPWPDALEAFTGSREISARPMVEYFRPLLGWLEEQNRGRRCGW